MSYKGKRLRVSQKVGFTPEELNMETGRQLLQGSVSLTLPAANDRIASSKSGRIVYDNLAFKQEVNLKYIFNLSNKN